MLPHELPKHLIKTEDFSKLGNFNKILEMLGFDGENQAVYPKKTYKNHRKTYFA